MSPVGPCEESPVRRDGAMKKHTIQNTIRGFTPRGAGAAGGT